MNLEEKIIKYLKENYSPLAIVLHGSRAIGLEKEHSDWDFLIFQKEGKPGTKREIKFNSNLEIKRLIYPIDKIECEMIGYFFRSENIKVVYDPENIVTGIINWNDEQIKKGNNFSEEYRMGGFAFLSSALDGMIDYKDDTLLAFNKKIEFYNKAVNCWFRILHKDFKPSDYKSFPIIKKEDPEFYVLIQKFVLTSSIPDGLITASEIIKHLFPDLYSLYPTNI